MSLSLFISLCSLCLSVSVPLSLSVSVSISLSFFLRRQFESLKDLLLALRMAGSWMGWQVRGGGAEQQVS